MAAGRGTAAANGREEVGRAGACLASQQAASQLVPSTRAYCSGASTQVPCIQRTKGRADSTKLRSRRPSCLEASLVDGLTSTSADSSDSDTCGAGAGVAGQGSMHGLPRPPWPCNHHHPPEAGLPANNTRRSHPEERRPGRRAALLAALAGGGGAGAQAVVQGLQASHHGATDGAQEALLQVCIVAAGWMRVEQADGAGVGARPHRRGTTTGRRGHLPFLNARPASNHSPKPGTRAQPGWRCELTPPGGAPCRWRSPPPALQASPAAAAGSGSAPPAPPPPALAARAEVRAALVGGARAATGGRAGQGRTCCRQCGDQQAHMPHPTCCRCCSQSS